MLPYDYSEVFNDYYDFTISKIEKYNFDTRTYTPADINLFQFNGIDGNGYIENKINVPSGAYRVTFDIRKNRTTIFSFQQAINVFNGLTTDIWQTISGEPYFKNNSNGNCILTITKAFIQTISRTTFYVSNDDDTFVEDSKRCGSYNYPLKSMKEAFEIINNSTIFDSAQEFSIILKDEGTYTLEDMQNRSTVVINKNVIVKGYKTETANSREKYVLKYAGDHRYPMFTIENENINVTFENLTVDGESDNDNKKFSETGFLKVSMSNVIVNIDNVEIKNFKISEAGPFTSVFNYYYITNNNTNNNTNTELNIENSKITNCGGCTYGGAIALKSTQCKIENSTISECYLISGGTKKNGGAIYLDSGSTCTITNSDICDNYLELSGSPLESCKGGAIFVASNATCNIEKSSNIYNNYIKPLSPVDCHGGAIYVALNGICNIKSANIYGNYINCSGSDNSFGGAIYSEGTLKLGDGQRKEDKPDVLIGKNDTYQGPNYIKSKSYSYGGAICVNGGSFSMNSDVCIGNNSAETSQGIYLNGNAISTDCGNYIFMNFTRDKEAFGGGLYIGLNVTDIRINGGIVNANDIYLNGSGGINRFYGAGIYSFNVCNLTNMKIKNNFISGENTDYIKGVGLYLGDSNSPDPCTLENIDISGNKSVQSNDGYSAMGVGAYLDLNRLTLVGNIKFGNYSNNSSGIDITLTGDEIIIDDSFTSSNINDNKIIIDCNENAPLICGSLFYTYFTQF